LPHIDQERSDVLNSDEIERIDELLELKEEKIDALLLKCNMDQEEITEVKSVIKQIPYVIFKFAREKTAKTANSQKISEDKIKFCVDVKQGELEVQVKRYSKPKVIKINTSNY
jgi:hypothetical protein